MQIQKEKHILQSFYQKQKEIHIIIEGNTYLLVHTKQKVFHSKQKEIHTFYLPSILYRIDSRQKEKQLPARFAPKNCERTQILQNIFKIINYTLIFAINNSKMGIMVLRKCHIWFCVPNLCLEVVSKHSSLKGFFAKKRE